MNMLLNGLTFFGIDLLEVVMSFLSLIPKFLYFIFTCLLSAVDMCQVVFRKLAGLDPIMISGEVTTGDSIYKILIDALFNGKYPAISTVFWSLIILGVFMLIVTTIIATIRIEYNPDKDKGNSKAGIIKNFFKALFSFAIVPIACIFGMVLSNSLVGVINNVTAVQANDLDDSYQYFEEWSGVITENDIIKDHVNNNEILGNTKASYYAYNIFGIVVPTTSEPFSGAVFRASAYSSNRFRQHGADYLLEINNSGISLGGMFGSNTNITDSSTAADIIDTAFAMNAKMKGSSDTVKYSITDSAKNSINPDYYMQGVPMFSSTTNLSSFSRYNVELVWFFYDLWSFNLIVGFVAVILLSKLYVDFCLQLMGRVFEIAGLFLASPVVISLMPMDGGSSLDRWRKTFIGKFGLIVVLVFGLNIVSPILTIVQDIKLFAIPVVDYIISTLFIVAALTAVNALMNTISTIIFDKSAYDKDGKFAAEVRSNYTKGANAAAGYVGSTVRGSARIAGMGAMVAGGAARTIGGGVVNASHLIDRGIAAQRERNEIRRQIGYDEARAHSQYTGMTHTDRNREIDAYLQTTEGKNLTARLGGVTAARKSLLIDGRTNYTGKDTSKMNAEESKAFEKYLYDKTNFDRSDEAKKYTAGSAEYTEALDKYRAMKEKEKIAMFEGGAPLSARQEQLQLNRARADKSWKEQITGSDEPIFKGASNFGKAITKGARSVANGVGRVSAKLAPAVNHLASGMKEATSSISGTEMFLGPTAKLFGAKPKDNKGK